jgi:flagellar biosynthetic protein FliP
MTAVLATSTPSHQPDSGWRRWWPFVRHYLEMVLTMGLGMMLLHPLWSVCLSVAGASHALDNDTFMALVMATDMSLGMVAWMRYRGHSWRSILEMSATMYVPFVVFFPALWAGAVSGELMLAAGHGLMLPAMLALMLWRREEYAGHCHTS